MGRIQSPAEWKAKASDIHEDKYDYSNSVYTGSNNKVSILCRTCGTIFPMVAAQHSSPSTRKGCPDCGKSKPNIRTRASRDSFIEKGHAAHNYKYNYERVIYVNNETEVIITCLQHGDFNQKPRDHTRKDRPRGCPDCGPIDGGKKRSKTQEQFVIECQTRFGRRYGLDRVDYQGVGKEVELLCNHCNKYFPVQPNRLLSGNSGCPHCNPRSKLNRRNTCNSTQQKHTQFDIFISAAQVRFGTETFDFSMSNLNPKTQVVTVHCIKHGPFSLKSASFLRSNCPCKECSNELKRKVHGAKFIENGHSLFGGKFDYNLVNYIRSDFKVDIICNVHGKFEITPANHLKSKTGCTKCGLELAIEARRSNNEVFLKKAILKHNGKYLYPKLGYKSKHSVIQVYCKIHDHTFGVPAHHHLSGQGCPLCSKEDRTYSLEQIVAMAQKHHGNYYDYSETKLIRVKEFFMVSCPHHGAFPCTPFDHARGRGHCPECHHLRGFDSSKQGTVYWLRAVNGPLDVVKIGISNQPTTRIKQLRRGTPFDFEPVALLNFDKGRDALNLETALHRILRDYNARLEDFDGCTEWFKVRDLTSDLMSHAILGNLVEYIAEL